MKVIAHRANLYGPNIETENTISSIEECFSKNIDVEIDIPIDSKNFERYSTNHDFYYDKEHTNGSIAYKVISDMGLI